MLKGMNWLYRGCIHVSDGGASVCHPSILQCTRRTTATPAARQGEVRILLMLSPSPSPSVLPSFRFMPVHIARQLLARTMEQWMIYAHRRIRTKQQQAHAPASECQQRRLWGTTCVQSESLTWLLVLRSAIICIKIKSRRGRSSQQRTLEPRPSPF
jgi:hypothetical protein